MNPIKSWLFPSRSLAAIFAPAAILALLVGGCGPSQGNAETFTITFAVETAATNVSTLSFTVRYTGGGNFLGEGDQVQCFESGNATGESSFSDDDDNDLTISVAAGDTEIAAGENVAECNFSSTVTPTSGNFAINDIVAADASDNEVVVTMSPVEVNSGSAQSTTTTTQTNETSSTTSTTEATAAAQGREPVLGLLSGVLL